MKWYEKFFESQMVRNELLRILNEDKPQNSFQETFQLREENKNLKDRVKELEGYNGNLQNQLKNMRDGNKENNWTYWADMTNKLAEALNEVSIKFLRIHCGGRTGPGWATTGALEDFRREVQEAPDPYALKNEVARLTHQLGAENLAKHAGMEQALGEMRRKDETIARLELELTGYAEKYNELTETLHAVASTLHASKDKNWMWSSHGPELVDAIKDREKHWGDLLSGLMCTVNLAMVPKSNPQLEWEEPLAKRIVASVYDFAQTKHNQIWDFEKKVKDLEYDNFHSSWGELTSGVVKVAQALGVKRYQGKDIAKSKRPYLAISGYQDGARIELELLESYLERTVEAAEKMKEDLRLALTWRNTAKHFEKKYVALNEAAWRMTNFIYRSNNLSEIQDAAHNFQKENAGW